MKLAIFDIDGTLVRGSSERMFLRYLLAKQQLGPRQILAFITFFFRYLPTGGVHTLKKNKAYLCGLRTTDVETLARRFVEERLSRRLYSPAVQRLQQHLNRGDTVVLMSGTLDAIATPLADMLGAAGTCATLCSQRDGVFLAQPPEVHPFDAAKLSLAQRVAAEHGVALADVSAYGDSTHDLYLLRAVGRPVAVNPQAALARTAEKNGWEIIDDSRPAESTLTP